MDTQRIRVVLLKESECQGGNCHDVGAFLKRTRLPVDFHEHPASQQGEPALVVVRCVSHARLVPALAGMRARWPKARFLGVFCDPPEPDGEPVAKLAKWLDDFVWCPLRETDLLPRVERLLPPIAAGPSSGIRNR